MTGAIPAEWFVIYGTHADMSEVRNFYRAALSERGWATGGGVSGIPGTHEIGIEAWNRDRLVFRLSLWRLEEWRGREHVGHEFPVIFEARVLEFADDPVTSP